MKKIESVAAIYLIRMYVTSTICIWHADVRTSVAIVTPQKLLSSPKSNKTDQVLRKMRFLIKEALKQIIIIYAFNISIKSKVSFPFYLFPILIRIMQ